MVCVMGMVVHVSALAPRAQPLQYGNDSSGLGVTLRQLNSIGTFMMFTAHPDDENNALLTLFAKGEGHRAVLVTATRGAGGQNEIGSELFDALAVLRTEELLAAHRLDGAEQYFTRAVDFGYSFSIEETLSQWGGSEILGDMVRMVRTVRPDVISAMSPDGRGGGQHHQASAVLAHEAYYAAADPDLFPEQINEGLRPWQAKKFYFSVGYPFGFGAGVPSGRRQAPDTKLTAVDLSAYDELLGMTYAELGSLARGMHKCQGMSQLVALPANEMGARFRLAETTIPGQREANETSLFDGIETSLMALTAFAGPDAIDTFTRALANISNHASDSLRGFERDGMSGARQPVVAGLLAVRDLRDRLADFELSEDSRAEIDFRLLIKERQFERAAVLAYGLQFEALVNDGTVIAGQDMRVSALVANQGDVEMIVRQVRVLGFGDYGGICDGDTVVTGGVYSCSQDVGIPSEARITDIHWSHESGVARRAVEPDVSFGVPFRPSPFRVMFDVELGGARIEFEIPIQHRYTEDIFSGEKRMTLKVMPRFAVSMTPGIVIIPRGMNEEREIRVTATNLGPDSVLGEVTLTLPRGWTATPSSAWIEFSREDESKTVRFRVSSNGANAGDYRVGAAVVYAGSSFDQGYQVIEYPHTGRRYLRRAAEGRFKLIDVVIAPNLSVGYIVGVGDEVPQAIEQLGASLEFIDADDLAWGELSRFDVIVTGVRAYERRQDLRANNHRLLQYVENGGTAIVQYNKFEFNQAEYGPYPANVSRNRVTDERAPVRVLVNDHPVFTWPNLIGTATWSDWVQERGLYFLGERDENYTDLISLEDPFEFNPGVKRGALVEARVGRGRWLYVGLGLWRQLPAGTSGSYALLANLLSLGLANP